MILEDLLVVIAINMQLIKNPYMTTYMEYCSNFLLKFLNQNKIDWYFNYKYY